MEITPKNWEKDKPEGNVKLSLHEKYYGEQIIRIANKKRTMFQTESFNTNRKGIRKKTLSIA